MNNRLRTGRSRKHSREEHSKTLALVLLIACIPTLGTIGLILLSSEPNLSDLIPNNSDVEGFEYLRWSALIQDQLAKPSLSSLNFGTKSVRALGYMMDGDRTIRSGELVGDFVLLPDAGNLMHPAHRDPDQMISVHLANHDQIPFTSRRLVWVWGNFRVSMDKKSYFTYHLDGSRVQPADASEISKYFH